MTSRIDYSVYLVTDDPSRYAGNWLDNVRAAVDGGVTCVQYRDTESDGATRYRRLRALRDAIGKTPIVVNNEAELARAVRAEGVHVGQRDLAPAAVRAIVGPACEIGLSITDPGQLEKADYASVDAFGVGPVFDARATKADAADAMGLEGLRTIVRALRLGGHPQRVVAIGGLTLDNAASVYAAGADGLALVSAFSKSPNANESARTLSLLAHHRRQ